MPSIGGGVFVLRTASDPESLATAARAAVHDVNPNLLVANVESEAIANRRAGCHPAPHSGKPQTAVPLVGGCMHCRQADLLIGRRFVNLPHRIVAARDEANG
jgi:hypothetical protein